MTKKEIMEYIYNTLMPIFLQNIPDNDKNYLSELYKKRLDKACNRITDELSEKDKKFYMDITIINEKKFCNKDLLVKKSLLIDDENFDKLCMLSIRAFALAREKLYEDKQISVEEACRIQNELDSLYNLTMDFNKRSAKMELSEADLDLRYASGQITNITSIRMGRERQNKINSK